MMTYEKLDQMFPYIVFVYGFLVSFVLNSDFLVRIAEERLPETLLRQLSAHRGLAMMCLWVGGVWILQNLWLT